MGSYVELWKSLGMDIEKHDALLQSQRPFFKEVVSSQKNRPKKMEYFDSLVAGSHTTRIKDLANLKAAGNKIVGAFCLYAPEELVTAAGAIMVGLCGGANFPVWEAETVLPRNLCPLIKSSFGFKIGYTCPYFQISDLLVGETTCDGKKKVYELLNELSPTHVMEIPHNPDTSQGRTLWLKELELFKQQLESLTGNKITAEKLKESIELINNRRKALKRLSDLRKNVPSPISGIDALLVNQVSCDDNIQRSTSKIHELCEELEDRVKNGEGVTSKNALRLMITGSPMAIPNWKLHHIAESLGASIVVEESCSGTRYFNQFVSPKGNSMDDLMAALVDRYSAIPCACFTPNNARLQSISDLAKDFHVDGVINYTLQFCHTFNVEGVKIETLLKKQNIPLLRVESDYSQEDTGQIQTRLEAFMEMISAKTARRDNS
ncbi:MAG: double-cubane-cluster-containing anaerobic reductase [Candidatus Bathyarchaeota archaeon]|nr:double-cubane-cluster-containing anaerobic reductase [Candidatus Bathyarchaeota archaeon]